MSSAFTKETDDQWLHDIQPTMQALILYLTRENNGIEVYEKRHYTNAAGIKVHEMNNGLLYAIDADSKWYVVEE